MVALSTPTKAVAPGHLRQIWAWLEAVPDPEIPVLSIVDLGIVRNLDWQDETLIVTVTPTYSGCPATAVINLTIEQALHDHGVMQVKIVQKLSPAWSTDWISAKGRQALSDYGIAPPIAGHACQSRRRGEAAPPVPCPRCQSLQTECISAFGSTPCKAQYRCTACLEPFDYFKCL